MDYLTFVDKRDDSQKANITYCIAYDSLNNFYIDGFTLATIGEGRFFYWDIKTDNWKASSNVFRNLDLKKVTNIELTNITDYKYFIQKSIPCKFVNKNLNPIYSSEPNDYIYNLPTECKNYLNYMIFNKYKYSSFENRYLIASDAISNTQEGSIIYNFNPEYLKQVSNKLHVGNNIFDCYIVDGNSNKFHGKIDVSNNSIVKKHEGSYMQSSQVNIDGKIYKKLTMFDNGVGVLKRGSYETMLVKLNIDNTLTILNANASYGTAPDISNSANYQSFGVSNKNERFCVTRYEQDGDSVLSSRSGFVYVNNIVRPINFGSISSWIDVIPPKIELPTTEVLGCKLSSNPITITHNSSVYVLDVVRTFILPTPHGEKYSDVISFKINLNNVIYNPMEDGSLYIIFDDRLNSFESIGSEPIEKYTHNSLYNDKSYITCDDIYYSGKYAYSYGDYEEDIDHPGSGWIRTFCRFDLEKGTWERLASPPSELINNPITSNILGNSKYVFIACDFRDTSNKKLGFKYDIEEKTWSDWVNFGDYQLWIENEGTYSQVDNIPGGHVIIDTDIKSVVVNNKEQLEILRGNNIPSVLIK